MSVSLVDIYLFIYLCLRTVMLKGCMHLPSLITCLDSVGLAQNDLTFPEIKFIFKGGGLLLLRSF